MRGRFVQIVILSLTLASTAAPVGSVWAQTPTAEVKLSKAHKKLMVLKPEEIEPLKLLPPPPTDGSPTQIAELDELRHIQTVRTPDQLDQSRWDGDHEDVSAFAAVLGPKFDLSKLPATRKLIDIVENEESAAATTAKRAFHRHRPWVFDQNLDVCEHSKMSDPLTSYPSGHATFAYAVAVVLAQLIPTKATALMNRASVFAYSRLVCEVHFRSDIVAGQVLGTAVGVLLLQSPELQPSIEAALRELHVAGLGADKSPETP